MKKTIILCVLALQLVGFSVIYFLYTPKAYYDLQYDMKGLITTSEHAPEKVRQLTAAINEIYQPHILDIAEDEWPHTPETIMKSNITQYVILIAENSKNKVTFRIVGTSLTEQEVSNDRYEFDMRGDEPVLQT